MLWASALLGQVAAAAGLEESIHLSAFARKVPGPPGVPKYSDILFSSRWPRVGSTSDPHDAFAAMRAFRATRMEWNYPGLNTAFISRVKTLGMPFSGAINSELPDEIGGTVKVLGRDKNAQGKLVGNPNLDFLQARGDVASADYRRILFANVRFLVEAGADSIFIDDPAMTYGDVRSEGGGYGDASLVQFRTYLARKTTSSDRVSWGLPDDVTSFDYAHYVRDHPKVPVPLRNHFVQFHREVLDDFYQDLRHKLNALAKRPIPLVCNNGSPQWQDFPYREYFDYWLGETSVHYGKPSPGRIHEKVHSAAALGKRQYFSPPNDNLEDLPTRESYISLTRRIIATSYACGSATIVPWDVWRRGSNVERFFGTREEFGDLYDLVADHPKWFDDHEEVCALTPGKVTLAPGMKTPPISVSPSEDVLVTVRATPNDPSSPIVVHVVDWSGKGRKISLELQNGTFGGSRGKALRADLLVSGKKSIAPISRLGQSADTTLFEIEDVSLWAMLVVEGQAPRAP